MQSIRNKLCRKVVFKWKHALIAVEVALQSVLSVILVDIVKVQAK